MARHTARRSDRYHAVVARSVLDRYQAETGEAISLPVPIEMIIERLYNLDILWDEIPEPPDTIILGALSPRESQIVLNTRHEALFDEVLGPERFTLAHELAHWIYDAEHPGQQTLDIDAQPSERYCYSRESPGLSHDERRRETNANRLAAHLLLPQHLVRAEPLEAVLSDPAGTAQRWQVSRQMLGIRLEELGLIDGASDAPQGFL